MLKWLAGFKLGMLAVSIVLIAISTIFFVEGEFWPWGWAVGIVFSFFSFKSETEKKGYRFLESPEGAPMFEMDHVAIPTNDVRGTAAYYVETFGAVILYVDDTWAFLRVGQGKLALVRPEQHPMHVALRVDLASLAAAATRARGRRSTSIGMGRRGFM